MTTPPHRRLESLQGRFLAVYVPLVVVCAALAVAGFEYMAGRAATEALGTKLDRVLESQAEVANEPLWEIDVERLELIAKAIAVDEDVAGVAFEDETGESLVAVGAAGQAADGLRTKRRRMVRIRPGGVEEPIGGFAITVTDARLGVESGQRLIWEIAFAIGLVSVAVLGGLMAFRRVVGAFLAGLPETPGESDRAPD